MIPWHLSSFASGEVPSSNVGVSSVSKIRIDLTRIRAPNPEARTAKSNLILEIGFVVDGKAHGTRVVIVKTCEGAAVFQSTAAPWPNS